MVGHSCRNLNVFVAGIVLCLSQALLTPHAEGAQKWLVYSEGVVLPGGEDLVGYSYYGYFEVPDDKVDTLDIPGRTQDIWNTIHQKTSPIKRSEKPITTRSEDVYLVAFFDPEKMDRPLICTKTEEAFKQSDAPVVPHETTITVSTILGDQSKKAAKAFPCDLETRDKENIKITYSVDKQLADNKKEEVLKGTVRVHELYRFRMQDSATSLFLAST